MKYILLCLSLVLILGCSQDTGLPLLAGPDSTHENAATDAGKIIPANPADSTRVDGVSGATQYVDDPYFGSGTTYWKNKNSSSQRKRYRHYHYTL